MNVLNLYTEVDKDCVTYKLTKGGPSLFNLNVDVPQINVWVTAPQIRYSGLQLRTSLSFLEGFDYQNAKKLTAELQAVADCGHMDDVQVPIEVFGANPNPRIRIGVGPMCMYDSKIEISTRSGKSFHSVFSKTINPSGSRDTIMVLVPIMTMSPDMPHNMSVSYIVGGY